MNQYVTGAIIKQFREKRGMTQAQLAQRLSVSDKAISKWETGRGYPDIVLLEPLAEALGLSIAELLAGESVSNTNRYFNMKRLKFYVCPLCGNVITATGEAVISCCGIMLPSLEAEDADAEHELWIEKVEDECYVRLKHPMSKEHYISFIAAVREDGCELEKLYPEGDAEARFKYSNIRWLYYYCNQHGLFRAKLNTGLQLL